MSEGGRFFEGESQVQKALLKIVRKLDELQVPYCVVGGMALFQHGYRRFTEDVDVLVSSESLKKIHAALDGHGYRPPFARSKNLRDVEFGVRIEFLIAGEYPGDGRKKPIAFPDPADVGIERDGIRYLDLPHLVELKLASGMTQPDRLKDLADVAELIKILGLREDLAESLDPFVRERYLELWRSSRKRYMTLWRNKWLTAEAESIQQMAATLRSAAEELEAMARDGVALDPEGGTGDDHARLFTNDPDVAAKYGFHDEAEFWEEDDEDEDEPEPSSDAAPTP